MPSVLPSSAIPNSSSGQNSEYKWIEATLKANGPTKKENRTVRHLTPPITNVELAKCSDNRQTKAIYRKTLRP